MPCVPNAHLKCHLLIDRNFPFRQNFLPRQQAAQSKVKFVRLILT